MSYYNKSIKVILKVNNIWFTMAEFNQDQRELAEETTNDLLKKFSGEVKLLGTDGKLLIGSEEDRLVVGAERRVKDYHTQEGEVKTLFGHDI